MAPVTGPSPRARRRAPPSAPAPSRTRRRRCSTPSTRWCFSRTRSIPSICSRTCSSSCARYSTYRAGSRISICTEALKPASRRSTRESARPWVVLGSSATRIVTSGCSATWAHWRRNVADDRHILVRSGLRASGATRLGGSRPSRSDTASEYCGPASLLAPSRSITWANAGRQNATAIGEYCRRLEVPRSRSRACVTYAPPADVRVEGRMPVMRVGCPEIDLSFSLDSLAAPACRTIPSTSAIGRGET